MTLLESKQRNISRENVHYLFKYLLLANFLQYMEAGAVPALLLSISSPSSFNMNSGQQGLLGGVVYLSLGIGGPFAGYLLRHANHKVTIVYAVASNMVFTLLWALTPVGRTYSTALFIGMRFMMGLCQCIVCVYLPLWTNENAPNDRRATWMSYLQASVPLGVMMGYIIASVFISLAGNSEYCGGLLCWRWPFLIEIICLAPLYLGLYLVPSAHMTVFVSSRKNANVSKGISPKEYISMDDSFSCQEPRHFGGTASCEVGKAEESSPLRRNSIHLSRPSPEKSIEDQKWRRQSIQTSMFDPLSTRDVVRRSSDDLACLDSSDNLFELIAGFQWSGGQTSPDDFELGLSSQPSLNLDDRNGLLELSYAQLEFEGKLEEETTKPVPTSPSKYGSLSSSGIAALYEAPELGVSSGTSAVGKSSADSSRPKYESFRDLKKKRRSSTVIPNGHQYSPLHATDEAVVAPNSDHITVDSTVTAASDSLEIKSIHIRAPDEELMHHPNLANRKDSRILDVEEEHEMSEEQGVNDSNSDSDTDSESDWAGFDSMVDSETLSMQRAQYNRSRSAADNSASSSAKVSSKSWLLYLSSVKVLLSSGVYRNLLGAMTCLYFTVTGIQYWGTKYLTISLHAPLPLVNFLFVVCAATGPTLGVFFGGWLIDRSGGYKGRKKRTKTMETCTYLGIFAFLCSLPITFIDNVFAVFALLWLTLFFGASILPASSGILVSIVPRQHRPTSSSLSLVVFNMLGYCLSLILSGYLMLLLEQYDDFCDYICSMTWGFRLVLFWSSFSVAFLIMGFLHVKRRNQERNADKGGLTHTTTSTTTKNSLLI